MVNTYTSSHVDWHDVDWSNALWWGLAAAAIVIVIYAFAGTGSLPGDAPVLIEEWVP